MRRIHGGLFLLVAILFSTSVTAQTGTFQPVLTYGRGVPQNAAWQPNGDKILVNSITGAWLYAGDDLADLAHFENLHNAVFSPDGRWLAGANEDGETQLYDSNSYEAVVLPQGFQDRNFSPDGRCLLGEIDAKPVLLDTTTFTPADLPVDYLNQPIPYFIWSPDSLKLLAVSGDNTLSVWRIGDPAPQFTIQPDIDNYPQWSPDSSRISLNDRIDNRVHIFDADTGKFLLELPPNPRENYSPEWSNDGATVWHPDSARIFRFYPSNDAVEIEIYDTNGNLLSTLQTGQLFNIWYSPDGQRLALPGGLYDLNSYQKTAEIYFDFWVYWSPDSQWFTIPGLFQSQIEILNGTSGEVVYTLTGHIDGFSSKSVWWSPDNKKLLSMDDRGQLILWDVMTGNLLTKLDHHVSLGTAYALSSDGYTAAIADTVGKIRLFNLQAGEIIATLPGHLAKADTLLWQPGGILLATQNRNGGSGTFWDGKDDRNLIYIWNGETGDLVHTIRGQAGLSSATWRPDGKQLLVGNEGDNSVVIWDATSNSESTIKVQIGYGYVPYPVISWSPDLQILLLDYNYATHGGQAIRLYDAVTGEMLVDRIYYQASANYYWDKDNQQLKFVSVRCPPYSGSNCTVTIRTIYDHANPPANPIYYANDTAVDVVLGAYKKFPVLAWSSNNRSLAITDGHTTWIWDVYDNTKNLLLTVPNSNGSNWSPDGSKVATANETSVAIWGIQDSLVQSLITIQNTDAIVWSPDSTKFATRGLDQEDWGVDVFNVDDGIQFLKQSNARFRSWSPDSEYVEVINEHSPGHFSDSIWNLTTDQKVVTLDGIAALWAADSDKFVEISGGVIRVWSRN